MPVIFSVNILKSLICILIIVQHFFHYFFNLI